MRVRWYVRLTPVPTPAPVLRGCEHQLNRASARHPYAFLMVNKPASRVVRQWLPT